MRKLAFRYRRLKEIYNGYKGNVGGECVCRSFSRETRLRPLGSRMEHTHPDPPDPGPVLTQA